MHRLPLHGFRVLELASGQDIAYAGRLLADFGAEVITVGAQASSDGDLARFLDYNKYNCSLDHQQKAAETLLLQLVSLSDVVLGDLSDRLTKAAREASPRFIHISAKTGECPFNAGAALAAVAIMALWRLRRSGEGLEVRIDPNGALLHLLGERFLAGEVEAPVTLPEMAPGQLPSILVAFAVGGVSPLPAPHWRFSETPAHIRLPSPFPGEHDSYVLQQLLGLSQGEVEDLRRKGIIAGAASR